MSGSERSTNSLVKARAVRELFMLARERAPAIVFIDEIDAVGSTRTNDGTQEAPSAAHPHAAPR